MKTADIVKAVRRAAREIHKGMKRGGPHSSPKGKKGYTRKAKHPKREKEQQ